MKKIITILMLSCFQSLYAQQGPALQPASRSLEAPLIYAAVIGKPMPAFSASSGDRLVSNNDLKGKVVYINFWFSACPPCITEIEQLNILAAKYLNDPSVIFLSITYDDDADIVAAKAKYNIAYDVYRLNRTECNELINNGGYPTNIILNADGEVVYMHAGGSTNKEKNESFYSNEIYPVIERERELYQASVTR